MEQYLRDTTKVHFGPLGWWKQNSDPDPKLSSSAKHCLTYCQLQPHVGAFFSKAGYIMNKAKSSLLPESN